MNLPILAFFIIFTVVFLIRMPIGLGMLVASIVYFILSPLPGATIDMAATKFLTEMSGSFIMIAVPLYIFMAEIMNSGKVTTIIFNFASALVGKHRGAMASQHRQLGHFLRHDRIGHRRRLRPQHRDEGVIEEGFDRPFTAAVTAATPTEGPIIPPSIPMIIYAMISGTSVARLFMGAVVPGVILASSC
jgi:TRAP-type mannitol/chloroaromatic compound transport system permease large subunit